MLQVGITYLEIYNEAGYDLLAPVTEARVVEDLPRVHIMEDEDGRLHMRNLSLHNVASEEEALNLVNFHQLILEVWGSDVCTFCSMQYFSVLGCCTCP